MRKTTVEDIQKVFGGLSELLRGVGEIGPVARMVTATVALKFMTDNREYFGLSDVPGWRQISIPLDNISGRLADLAEAVEHQLPHLSGVFSFESWADWKLIDRIVQELDMTDLSFNALENPDPLDGTIAFATDAWFTQLVRTFGGASGLELSTPIELSTLCARLLRPDKSAIYDGTTGLGSMLVEAAREAKRLTGRVPDLYGQDVNKETRSMGCLNLILHGLSTAQIALGNTLTDPRWTEIDHQLQRFDYVVMQPPFALKLRDKDVLDADRYGRFRRGLPSAAHADMAFVLHALASLTENGKAVMVQSHGMLIRGGSDERIRQTLLEDGLIEAVIFLPRNLLSGTGIPVALLVLNKDNPHPGEVLFIKADEEFLPGRFQNTLRSEDIDRICDTYWNTRTEDNYSFLVRLKDISDNEWNLNITRFLDTVVVESKLGKVEVFMRSYLDSATPKVRLKDAATSVDRGYGAPKDSEADAEEATHRLINLGDVTDDGIVKIDETTPIAGEFRKLRNHELAPGNIIIASRGLALKVAVIPEINETFVASANFNIVRLRPEFNPWFVKTFLESPIGLQLLQAQQRGSSIPVISYKDLENIEIPKLPLETQREIADAARTAEEQRRKVLEEVEQTYKQRYQSVYDMMGISATYKPEERS